MVIFPDESAKKRFVDPSYDCGIKIVDTIVCEKHRDQETGKIISHKIPKLPSWVKKVLIFDDLCDYGSSFMNVIESLPEGVIADLFIFHGVFTGEAVPLLLTKFNKVIVTNSLSAPQEQKDKLSQKDQDRVIVLDVWG